MMPRRVKTEGVADLICVPLSLVKMCLVMFFALLPPLGFVIYETNTENQQQSSSFSFFVSRDD